MYYGFPEHRTLSQSDTSIWIISINSPLIHLRLLQFVPLITEQHSGYCFACKTLVQGVVSKQAVVGTCRFKLDVPSTLNDASSRPSFVCHQAAVRAMPAEKRHRRA